jgi:hypothetical protein
MRGYTLRSLKHIKAVFKGQMLWRTKQHFLIAQGKIIEHARVKRFVAMCDFSGKECTTNLSNLSILLR